jgi:hypothetical protein
MNEVNNSTTCEAAAFVIHIGVREGIYRCNDMHTKFHEDWFRHSGSIKVITTAM